jgi:monofunctional chorismate mutase
MYIDHRCGRPPRRTTGGTRSLTHALGKYLPHTPGSIKTEHEPDIYDLRLEIDRLDAEILAAVQRRAEVSHTIGKARMASGGTRPGAQPRDCRVSGDTRIGCRNTST